MAMASSSKLLFFLSAIFILIAQAIAQPNYLYHLCLPFGNYTANNTYATNLNQVLPSPTSNINIDHGFYNSSNGQDTDKVYVIGLCRGDVKPDLCRSCLNNSTSNLTQLCPNQKEAIEWYDECMLRYSNRSIFNSMEGAPYFDGYNPNNVSANDLNQFKEVRSTLLNGLRSQAAAGGSLYKFATGNASFNSSQTIYGLVQCTPDLTEQLCNDCLVAAIGNLSSCCDERIGAKFGTPSCNVRFEINSFYGSTAYDAPPPSSLEAPQVSPPPPSTSATATKENGNTSRTIMTIVAPIVALVVLVISS